MEARAAVRLAHEIAEMIPAPPPSLDDDQMSHQMWEDLMMSAADGLARRYEGRAGVLEVAIGPPIEVGVNPAWRVLLMLAHARLVGATPGTSVVSYSTICAIG